MTLFLPQDIDGNPVPAIRLKDGAAHTVSTSGTAVRNGTAFDSETRIISLYATEPVYIAFGDASVTASSADHYFPANTYYDFAIGGDKVGQYTHVSAIAVSAAGVLYISEKE